MVASHVGSTSAGAQNLVTANLTWPAVVAGDWAFLFWGTISSSGLTDPTGFGTVFHTANTSGTMRNSLYLKKCDGTESGSLACTAAIAQRHAASMSVYRGLHPTSPIHAQTNFDQVAISPIVQPSAVTPTIPNTVALTAVLERASPAVNNTAWSIGGSFTERADSLLLGTGSGGVIVAIADDLVTERPPGVAVTPAAWNGDNGTGNVNDYAYSLLLAVAPSLILPAGFNRSRRHSLVR